MTKKQPLILLLFIILLLGVISRVSVLGWLSIVGIVTIVVLGVIHFWIHQRLIRNSIALKPFDLVWITFSHILFLCLFLFQGDFDDVTEYVVLESFTGKITVLDLTQYNWILFLIALFSYLILTVFLVFRLKQIDPKFLKVSGAKKTGSLGRGKAKSALVQIVVFLTLIFAIEVVLRWKGYQPGTLDPSFSLLDSIIYQPRFQADSMGVNSFVKNSETLPEAYKINAQGFRSSFDFDKATIDSLSRMGNKKTIMVVGDSYTEGCCANPVANSFVDLLALDSNLLVLNFGVGSADLMQYKLAVEEYGPYLKPDLIVVTFYLGNDIAYRKRKATPFVPLTYPIKGYRWLSSVPPPYLTTSETPYLRSAKQAYTFYVKHFTLLGENRSLPEKACAHSALCTQIYLGLKHKVKQYRWGYEVRVIKQRYDVTNELLHEIDSICSANNIDLIIATIPSPVDAVKNRNIEQRYGKYFQGLEWYYPNVQDFTKNDYDGLKTDNHFNNSGHEQYYKFLNKIIDQKLKY